MSKQGYKPMSIYSHLALPQAGSHGRGKGFVDLITEAVRSPSAGSGQSALALCPDQLYTC